MLLRGALSRSINFGLGILLLVPPCMMVYFWYVEEPSTLWPALSRTALGYFLGALIGVPAFVMNRRALTELYNTLSGKFFLSSQLALLDSRQGRNAMAYFFALMFLFWICAPLFHGISMSAISAFPYGLYLSANVLPFVFPPKR